MIPHRIAYFVRQPSVRIPSDVFGKFAEHSFTDFQVVIGGRDWSNDALQPTLKSQPRIGSAFSAVSIDGMTLGHPANRFA